MNGTTEVNPYDDGDKLLSVSVGVAVVIIMQPVPGGIPHPGGGGQGKVGGAKAEVGFVLETGATVKTEAPKDKGATTEKLGYNARRRIIFWQRS